MSKTVKYDGGQSWNYLGRFYGIDPTVLAAFNGQTVDPSTTIAKGTTLKIPSAADLVAFYPEYKKIFAAAGGKFGAVLRPPTLTEAIGDKELVGNDGNNLIVTSARMRRFSHTGDNYAHGAELRTPNPNLEGGTNVPDSRKLSFTKSWWKCNILVGDTMYGAGYAWPKSEFNRYLAPSGLLPALTFKGNRYADVVWVSPRFENGKVNKDKEWKAPTSTDLAGVKPGDVMLLHNKDGDPDRAGHSAIVSSKPRVDAYGNLQVRVVDIYGERWLDVGSEYEHVKAIVRPKKKLTPPKETVGGDPNKPQAVLDGSEDISNDATPAPTFAAQLSDGL